MCCVMFDNHCNVYSNHKKINQEPLPICSSSLPHWLVQPMKAITGKALVYKLYKITARHLFYCSHIQALEVYHAVLLCYCYHALPRKD